MIGRGNPALQKNKGKVKIHRRPVAETAKTAKAAAATGYWRGMEVKKKEPSHDQQAHTDANPKKHRKKAERKQLAAVVGAYAPCIN